MTQRTAPTMALHRRDFLKLSAGSAALLSAGALTATLAGCSRDGTPASGYAFLRQADLVLFTALVPAVLESCWPASDRAAQTEAILKAIDATAVRCLAPTQKALRDLFDLLNTGLTRRLAAGVGKPWAEVTPDEAQAFLARWQSSRLGLFNAGWRALTKFITGSWIGSPQGLAAAGYPGPMQPMFNAVNDLPVGGS